MPFIELGNWGTTLRDTQYIKAGRIRSGTITSQEIIIAGGTKGIFRSQNYNGTDTGWALTGDGIARFEDIFAEGGTLVDLTVTGILTMSSSGKIRTAASGQRMEIANADLNRISWFSGDANEQEEMYLEYEPSTFSNFWSAGYRLGLGLLDGEQPTIGMNGQNGGIAIFGKSITLSADGSTGNVLIREGGTDVIPGLAFGTSITTGLFLDTTDQLGFTCFGSEVGRFTASLFSVVVPIRVADGSASAPSYSFTSDTNTGMYRIGNDNIGWSLGNSLKWEMTTSAFKSTTNYAPTLKSAAGNSGTPAFVFTGDEDTGMFRYSTNHIGFSSGGTIILRSSATELRAPPVYTAIGTGTVVVVTSTGLMRRQSSARKYKKDITYRTDWLADVELKPVEYTLRETTGNEEERKERRLIGFIAEDIAAVNPMLGLSYDDEIEDYDDRAVAAILAAKIIRLEAQVKRLLVLLP